MQQRRTSITRRSALRMLAVAGALATTPASALADTQKQLDDAQAQLGVAEAQLDAIAASYESLSVEQSNTLDELDRVETRIAQIAASVEVLQRDVKAKQASLSKSVSEQYKDGSHGIVDLVLGASSVEELISNLYYFDKVTDEQTRLIDEVKEAQGRLDAERKELEAQQEMLREVSQTQAQQLEAMRDKQYEAQQLIDGLSEEVRALVVERDAELLAAQQEAARARQAREQAQSTAGTTGQQPSVAGTQSSAAAPAQTHATTSTQATAPAPAPEQDASRRATAAPEPVPDVPEAAPEPVPEATPEQEAVEEVLDEPMGSEGSGGSGAGSAAAVIESCMVTPSPGGGLCAGWCSDVMVNAGYGFVAGNANDMYAAFCYSSNRADLRPGMAVAVSTHPHTEAGRIYGHIGMYVGDGTVMDNVGYIRSISLDEWCDFYGQTVPVRWGWLNGIVLE